MASELLNTLRADGEKLLEAEIPGVAELAPIVGGLIAKLEGKLADLAGVTIDPAKLAAPEAAAAEAPAAPEPAPADPANASQGDTVESLRAKLAAAEAAQGQAGAGAAEPTVATTEQPQP